VGADQLSKQLDDTLGTDRAGDVDRQAFSGELIDDRQAFDLLAVRSNLANGVIRLVVAASVSTQPGQEAAFQ
jgi:hypothetical protein